MPDKKLTDSEIVKALECCANCESCDYETSNCPLNEEMECRSLLAKSALDLINRLQAKNETRHKVFETKCEELEIAKAENERLKKEVKYWETETKEARADIDQAVTEAKAEAYKECIEKVKTEAENATCVYEPDRPQADNMVYHISNKRLDNLLKELAGENND